MTKQATGFDSVKLKWQTIMRLILTRKCWS